MFRGWFQKPRNLLRWPSSLSQSIENPFQLDRLPDSTTTAELQHPSRRYTPAEDRRHTWLLLFYASLFGLVLALAEVYIFRFGSNEIYLSGLSTIAVWVSAITVFQYRKSSWQWFAYFLVCPAITSVLFYTADPYFKLALAMLAAMYTADCFATHYFYLKTTVPMSPDRVDRLRASGPIASVYSTHPQAVSSSTSSPSWPFLSFTSSSSLSHADCPVATSWRTCPFSP